MEHLKVVLKYILENGKMIKDMEEENKYIKIRDINSKDHLYMINIMVMEL